MPIGIDWNVGWLGVDDMVDSIQLNCTLADWTWCSIEIFPRFSKSEYLECVDVFSSRSYDCINLSMEIDFMWMTYWWCERCLQWMCFDVWIVADRNDAARFSVGYCSDGMLITGWSWCIHALCPELGRLDGQNVHMLNKCILSGGQLIEFDCVCMEIIWM